MGQENPAKSNWRKRSQSRPGSQKAKKNPVDKYTRFTDRVELERKLEREEIDIRFGVVAARKGFVTKDQILEALDVQLTENLSIGKHRLIGTILIDQGHLNIAQANEVLAYLGGVRGE